MALEPTKAYLQSFQNFMTLVHIQLKMSPEFLPTPINSAFCLIARLHTRRLMNGT